MFKNKPKNRSRRRFANAKNVVRSKPFLTFPRQAIPSNENHGKNLTIS